MRIGGRILRTGVYLPPDAGPARAEHCLEKGMKSLEYALRAWGATCLDLGPILATTTSRRPQRVRVRPGQPDSLFAYLHAEEVKEWKRIRRGVQEWLDDPVVVAARWPDRVFKNAEQSARHALTAAVEAFYWFDDVLWDYNEEVRVDLGTWQPELGTLAERAHALAHDVGETVGGLFGCTMRHDKGAWLRRCALTIMHNRLGQSPGMSMDYECGICGGDPLDCPHEAGNHYSMVADRRDDFCTICSERECEHTPGEQYQVRARLRPVNLQLHEVSVVPRPSDPLARFTEIEVEPERMREEIGFVPAPDATLFCYSCIGSCSGFRERTADPLNRRTR